MKRLIRNIIFLIVVLKSALAFAQIQQYFFVEDIVAVEYLNLKICIGENGETVSVTELPDQTTYDNKEVIQQIIEYRKGFDFLEGSKFSNTCFEQPFSIVNSKYQSLEAINTDCIANFKKGKYRYLDPQHENVKIVRRGSKQIEKTKESKLTFEVEWVSHCNYILTYLKVSEPKYQYLIGQKLNVKIIDVLDNGNYIYFSNLSDRTYVFGEMKKI